MIKVRNVSLLAATLLPVSIMPVLCNAQLSANATVMATGLQGPRGLKFGPDGALYVAEAGTGGKNSTGKACAQVVPPVGPYTGGSTARISRIDSSGHRTTVASGLPSSVDAMGDLQGVADLVFAHGTLYALLAGGGCSHGNTFPNGLISVDVHNGSWKLVSNLSHFLRTHPVKYPNPGDFEPDGTFYSMTPYHDRLYIVEPNHGQVMSVGYDGSTQSMIDISASQGHIVPTAITEWGGDFYLGNLNLFPIEPNFARILTLSRAECTRPSYSGLDDSSGPESLHIIASKAGFTTVVGTEFGPDGMLYVLELSDAAGNPAPGNGKILRVQPDGHIQTIATGLSVPTAMTFGPDGRIYVSNFGAAPAGAGQIVRIDVP
jgi:hypothetical protein